jgi:fructose-bisphosphate aldolase, class II
MPLARTRDLVDDARRASGATAAFNVITLEHAEAIAAGAERAGRPAILQISENAVRFHHGRLLPLARAVLAVAELSSARLSVHLDHVEDVELLHQSASAGVSSVMFDASKLEFGANLAATKAAAEWAHDHGLWMEAELGEVGGKEGAHAPGVRTDPAEAADFVAKTGVDGLAVAVGSSHAMTDRVAQLDFELVRALRQAVPVPLVLHGSSGVADDDLRRAVRAGITKVNVGTILNVAFTGAVRERLSDGSIVDPRKYLASAREAVSDTVASILRVLDVGAVETEPSGG